MYSPTMSRTFFDEQRIGRELERLGAMRLQAEGAPDLFIVVVKTIVRLGR